MELSLVTMNLHGYHPMGELPRYWESQEGRIRPIGAYPAGVPLSAYTTDELDRGHRRRLDQLAADWQNLRPDLICLQEVGAGCPWTDRDSSAFYHDFGDNWDWFEANSALRLARRLSGYEAILACRGNIGWHTTADTFRRERVVTFDGSSMRVVHDFGSNPYPQGLLVEGYAILFDCARWTMLDAEIWHLPFNEIGGRVTIQAVTMAENGGSGWFLLVNVHLGHKIAQLEQMIALQTALNEYRDRICLRLGRAHPSMIVCGDFNAPRDEAMLAVSGRSFGAGFGDLLARLWSLNDDSTYKPWASIRDSGEAARRINAVARRIWKQDDQWNDALFLAQSAATQTPLSGIAWVPDLPNLIDHIVVDGSWQVRNAGVLYSENRFSSSAGTSDHPSIYAALTRGDS
jgi:endonuclease/exonuclease/phosphatase family metal-dependent hydrolase